MEKKEEKGIVRDYSSDMSALIKEQNNFLIIGRRGSAKTTLGFHLAELMNGFIGKPVYTFRYPNEELLAKIPFKPTNITNFGHLHQLVDCVVLVDEAQLHFDVLNKKVNEDLKKLLAVSRQNNVSFIFITHNSYFITRGLFSYIDVRIIKEVTEGHWDVERPHMKKLYSSIYITGKDRFFVDSDVYRGEEYFDKPEWFTNEFSCVYRRETERKKTFFDKISEVLRPK
tara:strand:+ start:1353 stop:2033 length:681 start_codon:yes stop_codon:yes gene_type:complete